MNDFLHDAWKYYEYGRLYNNNLVPNQYVMVNTNQEYFIGNQWIHMPDNEAMRRLAKPTFNIIKRGTSLFVASLTSSNTTISFEPLSQRMPVVEVQVEELARRDITDDGKVDYFFIEQGRNFFSLNKETDYKILWTQISKIGEDVILIKRG